MTPTKPAAAPLTAAAVTANDDLSVLFGGESPSDVIHRVDHDTILFSGDVDKGNADALCVALRELENELLLSWGQYKRVIPSYTPRIKLHLSTNGGDVYAGLRMVDYITTSRIPIDTYATGMVASAGIFLLLAGSTRFAFPNAWMMIHDVSAMTQSDLGKLKSLTKHLTELQDSVNQGILNRTKLTKDQLEKLSNQEYWLDAGEALRVGLVDALVPVGHDLVTL